MNKWLKLLAGLILLIASIYIWGTNIFGFGAAAINFLKGGIIWLVILISIVLIVLGISELKE